MTYSLLSICFLAGSALLTTAIALLGRGRPRWGAVALTTIVLLLLTAVFDTIMIGVGFFEYADAHLLGIRVGLAPVEDFAYPVAGALLLPALWTVLRSRRDAGRRRERAGS